jgi:DNA-binding transcriptional LysR family regulator
MFDWSDLRHFLAVERTGTLANAARELHVDQTTVGRRIAQLEQGLGAKLFDRVPSGLRLTEAGRDVLCIAERLEAEALALERLVLGRDVNPAGPVRITTSEAFGARFLGPRVGQIRAKYEGVRLEIITDVRTFNLSRREADIAIRMSPTPQEGLILKKVCAIGWGLYAAKSYLARRGAPKTVGDVCKHDLCGYEDTINYLPEERWMATAANGASFVLRSNSTNLLHAAMQRGLAIGMLPCWLASTDDDFVRLLPDDAYVTRDLTLVVHEDVRRIARVRVTFDALAEMFLAEKETLAGK